MQFPQSAFCGTLATYEINVLKQYTQQIKLPPP